ncbi:hypothetical protein OG422_16025 [Streptomyces sp. NBC_01525]|uniref:hypothetical protein n=1 Tax=Streptomyces sp. NBC_01525 TaxID=2903893 RepID=UPI00386F820C
MAHRIARYLVPPLRRLLPARGRHRQAQGSRPTSCTAQKRRTLLVCPPPRHEAGHLRDIDLVRPYVLAHEQRQTENGHRAARSAVVGLPHSSGKGVRA